MPIEFRCDRCDRLLRTPDDTAGKQAKCPSCSAILTIPNQLSPGGGASGARLNPSQQPADPSQQPADPSQQPAIPSQQPADSFQQSADLANGGPSTSTDDQYLNPYAAPKGFRGESPSPFPGSEELCDGPPWERDGKSLATYWATVKEVIQAPIESFQRMRRDGGLVNPMWFGLLGGAIGTYVALLYQFGIPFLMTSISGEAEAKEMMIFMAGFAVVMIVFAPVGILLNLFISSGITHGMLMILGGPRQPFETTFRVIAYTAGSTSLILVIPICGGYIQGIVQIVYSILGLKSAHEISGFKATLAVLLPIFICCGSIIAVIGGIVAAGAWSTF